jgi:hypothetical protein
MSAVILPFPSAPRRKARWELNTEEIQGMGTNKIVSELADIVANAQAFSDPIPVDAPCLLLELNDRLPELYEIFEQVKAFGFPTANLIDAVLQRADDALDARQAYRMAA